MMKKRVKKQTILYQKHMKLLEDFETIKNENIKLKREKSELFAELESIISSAALEKMKAELNKYRSLTRQDLLTMYLKFK